MPAAKDKGWVCYLVECSDGTLYCGITNALGKRLAQHNAGEGAKYTRGRAPVRLVHAETCADKPAALRRERAIKAMSRAAKLALCVWLTGDGETGKMCVLPSGRLKR